MGGWVSKKCLKEVLPEPAWQRMATQSACVRWAVETAAWAPKRGSDGKEFKFLLNLIREEAERKQVEQRRAARPSSARVEGVFGPPRGGVLGARQREQYFLGARRQEPDVYQKEPRASARVGRSRASSMSVGRSRACSARGYVPYCRDPGDPRVAKGRERLGPNATCLTARASCCACRDAPVLTDEQRVIPPDPRGIILDEGAVGRWRADPALSFANPRAKAAWGPEATAVPARLSLAIADNRVNLSPLVTASIAQKRAYARRHGHALFVHAAFAGLYADGPIANNFDWALEGTWAKVVLAIQILEAAEEGSWVWVLDPDIVIMDMGRSLLPLLARAEAKNKHFLYANWRCGDGVNLGSFLVQNVPWTRTFLPS